MTAFRAKTFFVLALVCMTEFPNTNAVVFEGMHAPSEIPWYLRKINCGIPPPHCKTCGGQ